MNMYYVVLLSKTVQSGPYENLVDAGDNCPPGRAVLDLTTNKMLNIRKWYQSKARVIEWN